MVGVPTYKNTAGARALPVPRVLPPRVPSVAPWRPAGVPPRLPIPVNLPTRPVLPPWVRRVRPLPPQLVVIGVAITIATEGLPLVIPPDWLPFIPPSAGVGFAVPAGWTLQQQCSYGSNFVTNVAYSAALPNFGPFASAICYSPSLVMNPSGPTLQDQINGYGANNVGRVRIHTFAPRDAIRSWKANEAYIYRNAPGPVSEADFAPAVAPVYVPVQVPARRVVPTVAPSPQVVPRTAFDVVPGGLTVVPPPVGRPPKWVRERKTRGPWLARFLDSLADGVEEMWELFEILTDAAGYRFNPYNGRSERMDRLNWFFFEGGYLRPIDYDALWQAIRDNGLEDFVYGQIGQSSGQLAADWNWLVGPQTGLAM